jgi:hypothetical protein
MARPPGKQSPKKPPSILIKKAEPNTHIQVLVPQSIQEEREHLRKELLGQGINLAAMEVVALRELYARAREEMTGLKMGLTSPIERQASYPNGGSNPG